METLATAAALIIGNELLSGKIEEGNLAVLARALRARGVLLKRAVFVLDDVETIAREVRELSEAHDFLFTSGGVGPTHDDVTIEAVARAFGVPVVTAPSIEVLVRTYYAERWTAGLARLAEVPEGCVLEASADVPWPTVRMGNTWVLPGVPQAFRMKLPVILAKLGEHTAFVSRAVYTQMDEGHLKPLLDAVVAAYPDVDVGSYPKWFDASYKTKITFDARDAARVGVALEAFVATLPEGEPQRVE